MHALPEGVLELAAGDEAEDVGRVIPYGAARLLQGVLDLLDRGGEQEDRQAELGHLGLLLDQELPGSVDVEVPVLVVPGVVDRVEAAKADRAERGGGDVRARSQLGSGDLVARLGQGEQHRDVGDRPGGRPDVDELGLEYLPGQL